MACIDLGKLPLPAVTPLIESRSRLTREQMAEAMRMDLSSITRTLNPADDYFFHAGHIPYFCHVIGDDTLAQWFPARVEFLRASAGLEPEAAPLTASSSLLELAGMMRKVGGLARVVEQAAADGDIDRAEAREIRRKALGIIERCFGLLEGSAALLGQGGRRCKK